MTIFEKISSSNNIEIQMPNEIFADFNKMQFKNYKHKCFAYCYYYISNYLYRNVVYGLGYASELSMKRLALYMVSSYNSVSYIIRKDGLLDNSKYTETTTDFPVSYTLNDGILDFFGIKSLDRGVIKSSNRLSVKIPLKSFVREPHEGLDDYYTGTYYQFANTHNVPYKIFARTISDSELGIVGFYILSYLKMMCDRFPQGYQISNEDLSINVGCASRTIINYTKRLEMEGYIQSDRKKIGNKLFEKIYKCSF